MEDYTARYTDTAYDQHQALCTYNSRITEYTSSQKIRAIFTRESSYCFQRVLAIAILSVRLSVTRVDQSKTVQAKITISLPSTAWKTLVSGTVKLFHKFKGDHLERGR